MKFFKLHKPITARKDLSASDKLIYAVILDAGDGRTAAIGYRRIMSRAGIASADTVHRAIGRLEAAQLLTVERGSSGQRCIYHFPQSAPNNGALQETKALRKSERSIRKIGALAHRKSKHEETDPTGPLVSCFELLTAPAAKRN